MPAHHDHDILAPLVKVACELSPDSIFERFCEVLIDLGCRRAAIYVVDYDQVSLEPIAWAPAASEPEPQPVLGSAAGRAFLSQSTERDRTAEDEVRLWAPVRERADRMGVMELVLPEEGHSLAFVADEAGMLAGEHLHSVGRYTDRFELLRRRKAMNLAAEMQWTMLLPALNLETPRLSITGTLEPAYEIGGDAFDYAVLDDQLDLCIFDAMGHGVPATLASALALGAYRFGRRQGMELMDLALAVDRALVAEWGGDRFVTGHLAHLDAGTGELSWINAGHPPPLLVRGAHVEGELPCAPVPPLGLDANPHELCRFQLEPGDRVLFYTDGTIEARIGSDQLGLERFRGLIEHELSEDQPDTVVLRRLVGHVIEHIEGNPLADDVTLVLLQWHPENHEDKAAVIESR